MLSLLKNQYALLTSNHYSPTLPRLFQDSQCYNEGWGKKKSDQIMICKKESFWISYPLPLLSDKILSLKDLNNLKKKTIYVYKKNHKPAGQKYLLIFN